MDDKIILEIEQSLLGSLMRNNSNIIRVMEEGIKSSDFIIHEHGNLYERMHSLYSERQSFSLGEMSAVSGNFPYGRDPCSYTRDLIEYTINSLPDQATNYARDIKEHSRKRDIERAIKEIQNLLPTNSSEDLLGHISDIISEKIQSRHQKTGDQVFNEILCDIENPSPKWPTGLKQLDIKMAGGLHSGFVYGFAGKEKAGKTTLAGTISYNLNQIECPHMYVALEMGSKEIEQRNIARQVNENSLLFRNIKPGFIKKVITAKPSQFIHYLDAPGSTLQEILTEVSIAKIRYKIKGFILDYWQLVEGRENGQTEEQHIRFIAQRCADFSKKNKLWCIILAQLNSEGKTFGGNGLKKACDQLFFIESCSDDPTDLNRWLRMEASRYTPKVDVGSSKNPALILNEEVGPYFEEIG